MKPIYRIFGASGADITNNIAESIDNISLVDKTGIEHDELNISIAYGSPENGYSQNDIPPQGTRFNISLGYDRVPNVDPRYSGILYDLGAFIVNDVETKGSDKEVVTIKCNGFSFASGVQKQRKVAYEGLTLKEVLTQIADRNGATLIYDSTIRDPLVDRLDQIEETDQAFVRKLAETLNLVGKFTNNNILYFGTKGREKSLTGKILPTIELNRRDVSSYTHKQKTSNKFTGVQTSWLETENPPNNTYLAGDDTGDVQMTSEVYSTEAEAQEAANSTLQRLKSNEDTLSLTTIGDPRIQADSLVTLSSFPPHIPTQWRANTVRHDFSSSNYITHIECESIFKEQESES